MKKYCEYCKKDIEVKNGRAFGAHKTNCNNNPNKYLIKEKIKDAFSKKKKEFIKECIICGKEFKISRIFRNNKWKRLSRETNFCSRSCSNTRVHSEKTKEKISKTLRGDNNIFFTNCKTCNKQLGSKNKSGYCVKHGRDAWGEDQKNTYSLKMSKLLKGRTGGYRKKGGTGKQGLYKGYYCNSRWELAWVIFSLEHNIIFSRNTTGYEYIFNNEKRKYYPDFILDDGTFVEIKGYVSEQWIEKKKQFSGNLIVIEKKDIKKYLQYAIDKYGNNFIELYE